MMEYFIPAFMLFLAVWPIICYWLTKNEPYFKARQYHLDQAKIAQDAGDREGFTRHFNEFLKVER